MAIITEITAKNIQYLYKRSELPAKLATNKTEANNDKETPKSSDNFSKTQLPKDELILSVEAKQIIAEQKSNSNANQKTTNTEQEA